MTSSDEEILLRVPQVGYKNRIGTLYLMDRRIFWKADNEDTDNDSISHLYSHIKSQNILPPNHKKVLLRIILHSNDLFTFHFLNHAGAQHQANDLRQVKRLLFKILKQCREEATKERENKHKFLASHPDRLELYRNLVVPKFITSEEFWQNQAAKCDWVQEVQPPEIGVSSNFLSEIKVLDTQGLKYRIYPDTIKSIFKVYPSIKSLHTKHVPATLTEEQFWIKFVFSSYFRKNRSKHLNSPDFFAKCNKIDDEEIKKALSDRIIDPLLDIASFEDKCPYEGYGLQSEYSNSPSSGIGSQTLIGRINRESIMLCRELNNQPQPSGSAKRQNEEQISNITKKKKFTYDDLETNDNKLKTTPPLKLNMIERYLHGPRPEVVPENINPDDVISATAVILRDAEQWQHLRRLPPSSLISPEAALEALDELTPKDTPVKSFPVPVAFQMKAKKMYLTLTELLNQFWKCFPPTTPQLEEKVYRMHAALTKFDRRMLKSANPFNNPLKHLNRLFEAANQKFNDFQEWRSRPVVVLKLYDNNF